MVFSQKLFFISPKSVQVISLLNCWQNYWLNSSRYLIIAHKAILFGIRPWEPFRTCRCTHHKRVFLILQQECAAIQWQPQYQLPWRCSLLEQVLDGIFLSRLTLPANCMSVLNQGLLIIKRTVKSALWYFNSSFNHQKIHYNLFILPSMSFPLIMFQKSVQGNVFFLCIFDEMMSTYALSVLKYKKHKWQYFFKVSTRDSNVYFLNIVRGSRLN